MKLAPVVSALAVALATPAFASPPAQILVDMVDDTDDADEAALEAKLDGLDLRLNSIHAADERFFIADVDPSRLQDYLDRLKGDPRVEHAEPNFIYGLPENEMAQTFEMNAAPTRGPKPPNDPLWDKQWSFRMIDVQSAWETTQGEGVVVAVIDTGVAFEDHKKFKQVEDLAGTQFVTGYDFIKDTEHPNDDHGHGTHVAGTIAQTTNNGVGVAGIAPKAKIMPLKVLSKYGSGSAADIADAIRFAADEGAHVINMSLGGGMRSFVMQSAVAYARKKGVVVVCAAGNTGRGKVEFPAAYPGSFAVSSVGPSKKKAYYSSYGKQIAVSAPGGDKQSHGEEGGILQNTITPNAPGNPKQYLSFQGTSMAAPHVAGVAALVIGAGVTDPSKVEAILKDTATSVGGSWNNEYGHGIVNAGAAVTAAKSAKSGLWAYLSGLLAFGAFFIGQRKKLAGLGLAGAAGAVLATPMANLDLLAFGPTFHFSALWASAVPMFVATVLLLGVKRLRGVLIGLSVGWAAYLGLSAICMPADVLFIPGVASVLDRAWLLINAGALTMLALVTARVRR
ncbi:MAG: S8 family serine peptidase [Deltaproteobacteria bacterium]